MHLYIGFSSALFFWLRGSRGLWLSEPSRATSIAQCAYNVADVQSFMFPRELFGPSPLEIMVDRPIKRRDTEEQICHVWSGPLPERSFVDIGNDVYVASPALCFVQAASKLGFFDLAELGYELCGGYSRTPGVGAGFVKRSYRLTTPEQIALLIEKMAYASGSRKAGAALKRVLPNSHSPAETDMAVKTMFSRMQGGYGFPLAELNPMIVPTDEAARIAHRNTLYPDQLWRKQRVCLEYDSTLHHEKSADRTRDSLKRNALGCMGYKVITVTPSQLQDVYEFHGIAVEVARYLGMRMQPDTQKVLQRRYELNEAIRNRIRNDLTPTEWPYI